MLWVPVANSPMGQAGQHSSSCLPQDLPPGARVPSRPPPQDITQNLAPQTAVQWKCRESARAVSLFLVPRQKCTEGRLAARVRQSTWQPAPAPGRGWGGAPGEEGPLRLGVRVAVMLGSRLGRGGVRG